MLTRQVLLSAADEYLPGGSDVNREAILERHHTFQRSLEYVDVRVPYARAIAEKIPAGKVESRRVYKQLMVVIEIIAFLHQHQHQRDPNDKGQVIATPEDYILALRLLMKPLQDSLECGSRAYATYKNLKRIFPRGEFNSAELLTLGAFNNKVTRDKALKELADLEVLKCVDKGKGGRVSTSARWKWTGKSLESILPSSKIVFANRK